MPLRPFDAMEAWFERNPSPVTNFSEMLVWHLRHGYVFNTHEYFVMGRPIRLEPTREQTDEAIARLFVYEPREANCWYFCALSGNLRNSCKVLPFDLKWMAYHRMIRGKPRLFVRPLAPFRRRALVIDSSRN